MANNYTVALVAGILVLFIMVVASLIIYFTKRARKNIALYPNSSAFTSSVQDFDTKNKINLLITEAENLLAVGGKERAKEIYSEIRRHYSRLAAQDDELYSRISNLYNKILSSRRAN